MSIHVCKCEHNNRTEYHLRYPGMTQDEAQALADRINGGDLDNKLRGEVDRLRDLCDDLYSDILAAASLAPQGSGAYSLLHETIRLRRDRWARKPTSNV
jgi:hypothetical protein